MTATETKLPDPARDIAIAYYRATPHVFGPDYPDNSQCSMCEQHAEMPMHMPASPKPLTTVTMVMDVGHGSYSLVISCGHRNLTETFYDRRHKPTRVGSTVNCWTCDTEWHDANFPGLPPEVVAQIEALQPRCPECGEVVKYIPFVTWTKHEMLFELDGSAGTLDGESQQHDMVDEQPEWTPMILPQAGHLADGWYTGEIAVSCENNHEWKTRQLAWRADGSKHQWRIISAQ